MPTSIEDEERVLKQIRNSTDMSKETKGNLSQGDFVESEVIAAQSSQGTQVTGSCDFEAHFMDHSAFRCFALKTLLDGEEKISVLPLLTDSRGK
jgi:hypothetical protein